MKPMVETFRINHVFVMYGKLCFKVFLQYQGISELYAVIDCFSIYE